MPDSENYEYINPTPTTESEVKEYLRNNKFKIMVYDKDMVVGTASINLMKLYDEESYKVDQQSFLEKAPILKKEEESGSLEYDQQIGSIECFFILITEKCTNCKSCGKSFSKTSI